MSWRVNCRQSNMFATSTRKWRQYLLPRPFRHTTCWMKQFWLNSHETFNAKSLFQSAMGSAIQCILMSIIYSYVYLTNLTKDSKNSETALRQTRKTTKNHHHLMQQHETPRKGHSTINLYKLIKSKHNPNKKIKWANTPTDRPRMA